MMLSQPALCHLSPFIITIMVLVAATNAAPDSTSPRALPDDVLHVIFQRAEIVTLSSTHMVPDPALALAQERIQLEFFRDHLAPR